MTPQRLLAIFALIVVIVVLTLWLTRDEAFLKPENTGPPQVSSRILEAGGTDVARLVAARWAEPVLEG